MVVIKRTFEYLWHKFTIFKGGFKKDAPHNWGYLRVSVEKTRIFGLPEFVSVRVIRR
jgi:hypothetical protein